jgi:hypothetical protein
MRLALLTMIAWIVGLTAPVFDLGIVGPLSHGEPAFETAILVARPDPARGRAVPDVEGDDRDPPFGRFGRA